MIGILIADDHEVVREGVRRISDHHPDIKVVAEAGHGDEIMPLLEANDIAVLIMDISMPGPGFLSVMEQVKAVRPDLPVLVLSMYSEDEWARRALRAGASGYVAKAKTVTELAIAIRRVHGGGRYVSQDFAEALASQLTGDSEGPAHESLSNREYQVLCLLAAGKGLKEIGVELGVSPKTVSTFRTRTLEKLNLGSTAELIRYAAEHRLFL